MVTLALGYEKVARAPVVYFKPTDVLTALMTTATTSVIAVKEGRGVRAANHYDHLLDSGAAVSVPQIDARADSNLHIRGHVAP